MYKLKYDFKKNLYINFTEIFNQFHCKKYDKKSKLMFFIISYQNAIMKSL